MNAGEQTPTETRRPDPEHTIFVDADEDRFAWRARIKRTRTGRRVYRTLVAVVGLGIMAVGVVAIPLPGPGWAIVFVGLAILASEFDRAERVLAFGRRQVHRWTTWLSAQRLWVRLLVGVATLALVLGLFWTYFELAGVPTWLPDTPEHWIHEAPGLE